MGFRLSMYRLGSEAARAALSYDVTHRNVYYFTKMELKEQKRFTQ